MKVIQDLSIIRFEKKNIVTIGTFDGVHLGHQKIINRLLEQKTDTNEVSIITFSNHPKNILQSSEHIQLLTTIKEKTILFEKIGVDNLVFLEFTKSLSQLSGEEFVKSILVDLLKIEKIIIGYDHRFGKNRESNIFDLIQFGEKYGFDVEQISAEELDQIAISSTCIRNHISKGDIKKANSLLGYSYAIEGQVVEGQQLGRTIGFPTANVALNDTHKLLPKKGVYIVHAILNNIGYAAMMNIGNRPTLEGVNDTIEVHLLNYDKVPFYNQILKIEVLDFIRDEIKFSSLEALKTQIEKDKITTEKFFEQNPVSF